MESAARRNQDQPDEGGGDASGALREGELASLYGGIDQSDAPYPLLVGPWEGDVWDEDSDLDPQILAGLLRLGP
jgi:hypothetical protein